jgi:hypothetical protein
MKRFKFDKPLVESPYPPSSKDVYWVDIDESTGQLASIKTFNANSSTWETAMMSGDTLHFNGITYNEDLNSISVGTKTAAIGND